ncbi:MAG TPA: sialate O-acetylesterase [Pseudolabrys sp.]|jgi:hypothetical protein
MSYPAAFVIALGILGAAGAVLFAWRLRRAMRFHGEALGRLTSESSQRLSAVKDELSVVKNELSIVKNEQGRIAETADNLLRLVNDLRNQKGPSASRSGRPSDIVLDETDSYENLDQNWFSIHDTAGRKQTTAAIDGDRSRTAVIIILGQSNAANHGSGRYVAKHRVDNFNIYDGKCYRAEDPLLGASGDGGNFATRLGDKIIEDGLFDRVILAPIGMGGTTVEQWADEGMFNRRIPVLIRRLYDAGLSADFILWHQGEGNAGMGDRDGRQYRKNLLEVVETFRRYGVTAPFLVALATLCGEPHPNAQNIRAGQKGAVDPSASIYQGPDTDIIGVDYRWDKCHFDELGLSLAAALWLEVIAEFQSGRLQAAKALRDA